jgi:hypothetical protein
LNDRSLRVGFGFEEGSDESDVAAAHNLDDHARLVERWATSVWQAWAPHHGVVRAWIDGNRSGRPHPDSRVPRMSFPTDRSKGR